MSEKLHTKDSPKCAVIIKEIAVKTLLFLRIKIDVQIDCRGL